MQQWKLLPFHKSFVKCLATSFVGSVTNVKINVNLHDIIPKCLDYLLRLQKMHYTLFMDCLTSVNGRTVCRLRAGWQVDGNIKLVTWNKCILWCTVRNTSNFTMLFIQVDPPAECLYRDIHISLFYRAF